MIIKIFLTAIVFLIPLVLIAKDVEKMFTELGKNIWIALTIFTLLTCFTSIILFIWGVGV